MSKREPLRGYRQKMREHEDRNDPETPVRDEEAHSNAPQSLTGSSRHNRFRRRQDAQEHENLYAEVLKDSGIDTEGMGEEEKEQIAKILLLSKSELEVESESEQKNPAVISRDKGSSQEQSEESSDESVVCLSPVKPRPKVNTNIDTQDLREFEDEVEEATQASPLNGSMSQIFTQSQSDEDETQPPSQDLFSKTPGSGQSQITANEEAPQDPEEIDIADCPTLAEDMVDGSFPVRSGNRGDGEKTEPLDVYMAEATGSQGANVIEIKVQRVETESQRQSQERQSPILNDAPGRKRKATSVVNPEPKQSRLEVEDKDEPVSFSMGTYLLDNDKPANSKPLKRHYRRQRRSLKEKKFFSPSFSHSECNHYSEVIFQLFNVYRIALRDAQCGRLTHVPWGEPVKVGRHMSRTIDLKKRGRDSCYFETLSSEDELEIFAKSKAAELALEVESGYNDSDEDVRSRHSKRKAEKKDPDYNSRIDSDEEDFISIKKSSRPPPRNRRRTSQEGSPEVQEFQDDDDWLSTRGDKSRTRESVLSKGSRRLGRNTVVRKPQLDFLKEKGATDDNEKEDAGNKKSLTFKGGNRTYSKRAKTSTLHVRSDSPIFTNDDEILRLDEEDETACFDDTRRDGNIKESKENIAEPSTSFQKIAPLFKKGVKRAEKQTVRKTFTFKSSASGSVEVSTKLDTVSDDEEVLPSTSGSGVGYMSAFLSPTSPKFSRDLSRLRLGHRSDKVNPFKEAIQFSETKSKKSDICSLEEYPDTLLENDDIIIEARGKRSVKNHDTDSLQTGDIKQQPHVEDRTVENVEEEIMEQPSKLSRGKRISAKGVKVTDPEKGKKKESTILDYAKVGSKSSAAEAEADIETENVRQSPDEENFEIPSSAVFSSRNKRQSSMFSENDESFNLGVNPAKAFPVIFESSGSCPSTSGQDGAPKSPKFGRKSSNDVVKEADSEKTDLLEDMQETPSVYIATTEDDSPVAKATRRKTEEGQEETSAVRQRKRRRKRNSSENLSGESPSQVQEENSEKEGRTAQGTDQKKNDEGMACPLCGVTFSLESIEAHASSCEGIPPGDAQGSAETPEKWRFALGHQSDTGDGDEETCYICDGVFRKGEEYQKHVDECLAEARRQQAQLEQGSRVRRGRATRNRPANESDDEVDGRHSDPGGSRKRRRVEVGNGVTVVESGTPSPRFSTSESESESESERNDSGSVDSENDGKERKGSVRQSASRPDDDIDFNAISNSPIKTFRKIGQLDGCLIDFSNQFKKSGKIRRKPVETKRKKSKAGKRKRPVRRKKSTSRK